MGYNTIELHGNQRCDYFYVGHEDISDEEFEQKTIFSEPDEWSEDTLLLAKFGDDGLVAGNSSLVDNITDYEIRRRKGSSQYTEHVGFVKEVHENSRFLIDYSAANNSSYIYYLYPISQDNTLTSYVSKSVQTDWDYWSLMVVDETDRENVFYLNKLFKFELNLQTGDMSNNSNVQVSNNFTKYPTVQLSKVNYWSGTLSALCGFITADDTEYVQTPNLIEELKSLTSETRKMFLKDILGSIWEIKITSPITISTDDKLLQRIKTVSFSWAEVGDAKGISIINDPYKKTENFVLTETGELVRYIDYIWDEQYVWDDSYIWTAHEEDVSHYTNSGREIVENAKIGGGISGFME